MVIKNATQLISDIDAQMKAGGSITYSEIKKLLMELSGEVSIEIREGAGKVYRFIPVPDGYRYLGIITEK